MSSARDEILGRIRAAIDGAASQPEPEPPAYRRSGALGPEEREELVRLRRENRQLLMERDILKKAAAFFAKEGSK